MKRKLLLLVVLVAIVAAVGGFNSAVNRVNKLVATKPNISSPTSDSQEGLIGISASPIVNKLDQQIVGIYVDGVFINTPADMAGIESEDIILGINDKPLNQFKDLDAALKEIRGKPETEVSLVVRRATGETRKFNITRKNIDLSKVPRKVTFTGKIIRKQYSETVLRIPVTLLVIRTNYDRYYYNVGLDGREKSPKKGDWIKAQIIMDPPGQFTLDNNVGVSWSQVKGEDGTITSEQISWPRIREYKIVSPPVNKPLPAPVP